MKKYILAVGVLSLGIASSCQNMQKPVANHQVVEHSKEQHLMDQVQKDALKYFWDFAEPNSLLARERYHQDGVYPQNDSHVVTTGGSGFGLMSLLVGVERGFIPRAEAVDRLTHIADFLASAERHHGAWSHWIDGRNGKTVSFGKKDDGGDLVETAFLVQGLITVREYFKNGTAKEKALAEKMDALWKGVDWQWYTKGEKVLYWHWSPNYGWEMNFPLEGYNECLITYVLAASSPTHPIDSETYYKGWTRNGTYLSENSKYGLNLMVQHNGAQEYGGPLFWAHYSYLGLDPRGLSDRLVKDYFELNRNHVLISYRYALENPKNFKGYGENYWGMTASYTRNPDGSVGYTAHMPSNDRGVITPTAALSSFPYTPEESMNVLRYLYEEKKNLSEVQDRTMLPPCITITGPLHAIWLSTRVLLHQ